MKPGPGFGSACTVVVRRNGFPLRLELIGEKDWQAGRAQYRAGKYAEAIETLKKRDADRRSVPADPAFLTMAEHRLGHTRAAHEYFDRLRASMRNPRWASDPESQSFLKEAASLLSVAASRPARND